MNEKTLKKEFEEWAMHNLPHATLQWSEYHGEYAARPVEGAWIAWLESARRADRKAREECAEICKKKASRIREYNERNTQAEWAAVMVDYCEEEIRAMIPEEPS